LDGPHLESRSRVIICELIGYGVCACVSRESLAKDKASFGDLSEIGVRIDKIHVYSVVGHMITRILGVA
jgi:hypothetical protein